MESIEKSSEYYVSKDIPEVLRDLEVSSKGLHEAEVSKRIKKYGYNVIAEEKKNHWIVEYLLNFKDPLVLILLISAIVSYVLGETVNAGIIFVIILFSTTLNFFQEFNASNAAKKLRERIATDTTVIRDGKEQDIKIKNVVPGDILLLNAGDIIPADARIIEARDFFINQSSLTGESFPVEKTASTLSTNDMTLTEITNCVFSGSSVITGSAMAVVLQTGANTEFGKIAEKLTEKQIQSEFTIGVKNFSMMIMRITIFFVLFIFLFTVFFKNTELLTAFTFSIAVAVGLTPELLPMIMSITMAKGSLTMAKKGVIVKKLAAIPDFGEMNLLCTDKTGTLTQDKIELVKYMDVAGNHSEQVLLFSYLNSFYQTGIKNPMDEAVIRYKREDIHLYDKVDEIPFDFERKRMSVIVKNKHKQFLITKGAPEEIFPICDRYHKKDEERTLSGFIHKEMLQLYRSLSTDGFRVLGVAVKEVKTKKTYSKVDETEMSFVGFIAFLDPAKADVKAVLSDLEAMGIEIKIITGDNELVTQKIGKEVGLPIKGVLLGKEIEKMTIESLRVVAERTTIFARCSPVIKNKILQALKSGGYVIGYMGDGINDAPALKTADVGISVNNAVDVAKESADMILTHKSLGQLRDGVLEGRKTFGNTMKYIMMGISSSFGNMFSVLGAVLFLPFLPMLPIQILLNNLLYDLSQISIPTDNVDKEYLLKPKKWDMQFIKKFMFTFGPISSLFDFLTFFVLYSVFSLSTGGFQTGWFMQSIATQTFIILIIRTRHIAFLKSNASIYLIISTIAVVAIGWIIPYTQFGTYLQFQPLPLNVVAVLVMIVIGYMITIELGKRVFYKYNPQ